MKQLKQFLIAVVATVFSSTAFAANWVLVSSTYEVDTESIQRGSIFTSIWTRFDTPEEKDVASIYALYDIKCATREFRVRATVGYSLPKGEGKVVDSRNRVTPFIPIIPESNADYLYQFICKSRK